MNHDLVGFISICVALMFAAAWLLGYKSGRVSAFGEARRDLDRRIAAADRKERQ